MIPASFGGLLKDLRIRKNLTQQDVAYALGWTEPSRLSRIEQGTTHKPTRETVDKLMQVLQLNDSEQGQLLLAGGYIPTSEEIHKIQRLIDPFISQWKYPIYVYDFSWRIVYLNEMAQKVLHHYRVLNESSKDSPKHILEILFHPDYPPHKFLHRLEKQEFHDMLLRTLIQFVHAQKERTREQWYSSLIGTLIKNSLFRTLWQEAKKHELLNKDISYADIANYDREIIIHPEDTKKRLQFHFLMVPIIQDPRFIIEFYFPLDEVTFHYFKNSQKE